MKKNVEETKVFTTPRVITTIHIFPYGNGYRVQKSRVHNDPSSSLLMTGIDDYFETAELAIARFNFYVMEYAEPV